MADGIIGVDEPATIDKKLDTETLTVGANTVERERIQITGSAATEIARVLSTAPAAGDMALAVRNIPSGTQAISHANLDVALSTLLAEATFTARINTQGQKAMTASTPVVIASDQSTLPVSIAATVQVDVTDEAARDLGKVDVASLDQYVPIDVDTGAGTLNAIPITWRKASALGVEFGTSTDPVRTDPTGTTTQPISHANLDVALSTRLDDSKFPATAALVDLDANPSLTKIQTFPMTWSGVTWNRLIGSSGGTDGMTAAAINVQTLNKNMGFSGSGWDRLRSGANNADNEAVTTLGNLNTKSYLYEFDGTAWDRVTAIAKAAQLPAALISGRLDINIGASGINIPVIGELAHDAVDSGNPQKIGGQARTTNPTAVGDADRVNAIFDDVGRQVVVPNQVRDLVVRQTTTISASTAETTILTSAASTFHDLTLLTVSNTSATDTRVDFRDATAGTIQFSLFVKAGAVVGFSLTTPMTQTTAASAWTAQSSAAVTDLRILVQAVKNV